MKSCPRNIIEFEKQFSSEQKCREYLFNLRWPEGLKCPKCQHPCLRGGCLEHIKVVFSMLIIIWMNLLFDLTVEHPNPGVCFSID